jgi:hypothetical protein
MTMTKKIGTLVSFEAADTIALASMEDQLKFLKKQLKRHLKHGEWMHPEDVTRFQNVVIPALKEVIEYYGGGY